MTAFKALLLAALCTSASSIQYAADEGEGSGAQFEGLGPHNWQDFFDPFSDAPPQVKYNPRAASISSFPQALQYAQDSARAVGRQMGVPYVPHDFSERLGDGSVEATRAKTFELFGQMKERVAGIDGIIDYGLSTVGSGRKVPPEEAFNAYTMVANRLGAKTLANQFAPLLRSTTPPNPSMMFNMIGNALASLNMPGETVNFYRQMASKFSGGQTMTQHGFQALQNQTMGYLKNRTVLRNRAAKTKFTRSSAPDYYKSTNNEMIISFALPCAKGSLVCFSLSNEMYSFADGPGYFGGQYLSKTDKGLALALGVSTQTPWSQISTPFYIFPEHAVGHEYDLKFAPGKYDLAEAFSNKVDMSAAVRLRDTSDCVGTGEGSADNPRVFTCPYACLQLVGGQPKIYSIMEINPVRSVDADAFESSYDLLSYGGQIGGPYEAEAMPSWAAVAFYRAM